MKFKGKTAIITGSGQGIGRALAEGLAAEGANIVIVDVVDELGQNTADEIKKNYGVDTLYAKTDITNVENIKEMVKKTVDKFGRIDILCNVAGICKQDPVLDPSEKIWDLTMDINVKGGYFTATECAKVMKEQGGGSIINICSTSGYCTSSTEMLAYDISKSAVRMLTTGLANWLGQYNIRVNAIAPATTKTKMVLDLFGEEYWQGEWVRINYPLGRIAEVTDHINAVTFLCSEDASYINGQTIMVDGGHLTAYRRKEVEEMLKI